jgi:hypothetical protein
VKRMRREGAGRTRRYYLDIRITCLCKASATYMLIRSSQSALSFGRWPLGAFDIECRLVLDEQPGSLSTVGLVVRTIEVISMHVTAELAHSV